MNEVFNVSERAHTLGGHCGEVRIWHCTFDHEETLRSSILQRFKTLSDGIAMQAKMAYASEYFQKRYGE